MVILLLILLPMLIAGVCYFVGKQHKRARDVLAVCGVALELALAILLLFLPEHSLALGSVRLFEADGFRRVYAIVIAFLWFMTIVFTDEYFTHYKNRGRYYLFNLLTLGLMMGEFFSARLSIGYLFLVLMSGSCYVWMRHDDTPASARVGTEFLHSALFTGIVGAVGLILLWWKLGTTEIALLYDAGKACPQRGMVYFAGGCLMLAFGARAGMVPMHQWLTDTSPVPAPGSALVSGVVTKSGVWGVLVLSCQLFRHDAAWGTVIVLLGTMTMLTGAVLGVYSDNLRRTLACSSVSQIGYILIGIGMIGILGEENALAARGTLLHMVNHSLFKLVLYLCAGTVVMNLHKLELNDIRGFGRGKPLLLICFLFGALGLGGIPGWSGYISKTLLHEAIVEGALHHGWLRVIEWLFLFTGGLTLSYMMKLFVAIFVEKHPTEQARFDAKTPCMKLRSGAAMAFSAAFLLVFGLAANRTLDRIGDFGVDFLGGEDLHHAVSYFSWENLKGALICVLISLPVYFLFVRRHLMRDGDYLDVPILPGKRN